MHLFFFDFDESDDYLEQVFDTLHNLVDSGHEQLDLLVEHKKFFDESEHTVSVIHSMHVLPLLLLLLLLLLQPARKSRTPLRSSLN